MQAPGLSEPPTNNRDGEREVGLQLFKNAARCPIRLSERAHPARRLVIPAPTTIGAIFFILLSFFHFPKNPSRDKVKGIMLDNLVFVLTQKLALFFVAGL